MPPPCGLLDMKRRWTGMGSAVGRRWRRHRAARGRARCRLIVVNGVVVGVGGEVEVMKVKLGALRSVGNQAPAPAWCSDSERTDH